MNSRNAHSKPLLMWPVSMHCMAFFLVMPCSSSVDFSTNSHSPKIEGKKRQQKSKEKEREEKNKNKEKNNTTTSRRRSLSCIPLHLLP